jgi:hypothetical protein
MMPNQQLFDKINQKLVAEFDDKLAQINSRLSQDEIDMELVAAIHLIKSILFSF